MDAVIYAATKAWTDDLTDTELLTCFNTMTAGWDPRTKPWYAKVAGLFDQEGVKANAVTVEMVGRLVIERFAPPATEVNSDARQD